MKRNILSRKIETDRSVGHCRSKKESEEVGQKLDRSGQKWEDVGRNETTNVGIGLPNGRWALKSEAEWPVHPAGGVRGARMGMRYARDLVQVGSWVSIHVLLSTAFASAAALKFTRSLPAVAFVLILQHLRICNRSPRRPD